MDDLDDTRSYIDRPQAIVHAVRQARLPRLNALIVGAAAVLGSAVRDRELLVEWIESGATVTPSDQDAIVVALGLLGEVPPLGRIWENESDPRRASAVIAAIALGVDSRDERASLLRSVERAARGAAVSVAEQALFREQTGNRLAVLD